MSSLLRRLRTTPFRDMVRGRLTGRFDVDALLWRAALPPTIADLVRETVKRTRLWRFEKLDVADELIGHFADGLDAGRSAETLIESFGQTTRAARLIRRAVKRKRPLPWKVWHRWWQGVGALLALVVVVWLYAFVRLHTGEPVIARDYLAQLTQAARAVPEDQRAWPLYREALLMLPAGPRNDVLELVREAAKQPGLGYVLGYAADEADLGLWPGLAGYHDESGRAMGLSALLMPHLAELRKLESLLADDTILAASEGDAARARANVDAMLGLAEHIRETPVLIAELTSLAQLRLAFQALAACVESDLFNDDDLRALAHQLAGIRDGRIAVRLDAERLLYRDLIQRIYTDDGNGDGRPTAVGLRAGKGIAGGIGVALSFDALAPAASLFMASRREMSEMWAGVFARVEAEYAKPLWQQDIVGLEVMGEELRTTASQLRYPLLGVLIPALARLGVTPEIVTMERDALLVAISLHIYSQREGVGPTSLDVLVPDLLPAIPMDRFDGRPIRYAIEDGRPVLYSVGADGEGRMILWPMPAIQRHSSR